MMSSSLKLPVDLSKTSIKRACKISKYQLPSKMEVYSVMVDFLSKVISEMMKGAQKENIDISRVVCYVKLVENQLLFKLET